MRANVTDEALALAATTSTCNYLLIAAFTSACATGQLYAAVRIHVKMFCWLVEWSHQRHC